MTIKEWVGLQEIAQMLGTTAQAVAQRKHRGTLPEPDQYISGNPAWRTITIQRWIDEKGHTK